MTINWATPLQGGRFEIKERLILTNRDLTKRDCILIEVEEYTLLGRICAYFRGFIDKDIVIKPKFSCGDIVCFVNNESRLTKGVIESAWLGHKDGVSYIVKESENEV